MFFFQLYKGYCALPSPEPDHGLPVPEPAPPGQLSVRGEQEGQPGAGVHRGAVQQGGGPGDLREPTGDGENRKVCRISEPWMVQNRIFSFNGSNRPFCLLLHLAAVLLILACFPNLSFELLYAVATVMTGLAFIYSFASFRCCLAHFNFQPFLTNLGVVLLV